MILGTRNRHVSRLHMKAQRWQRWQLRQPPAANAWWSWALFQWDPKVNLTNKSSPQKKQHAHPHRTPFKRSLTKTLGNWGPCQHDDIVCGVSVSHHPEMHQAQHIHQAQTVVDALSHVVRNATRMCFIQWKRHASSNVVFWSGFPWQSECSNRNQQVIPNVWLAVSWLVSKFTLSKCVRFSYQRDQKVLFWTICNNANLRSCKTKASAPFLDNCASKQANELAQLLAAACQICFMSCSAHTEATMSKQKPALPGNWGVRCHFARIFPLHRGGFGWNPMF